MQPLITQSTSSLRNAGVLTVSMNGQSPMRTCDRSSKQHVGHPPPLTSNLGVMSSRRKKTPKNSRDFFPAWWKATKFGQRQLLRWHLASQASSLPVMASPIARPFRPSNDRNFSRQGTRDL